jgi:hypothetical protein
VFPALSLAVTVTVVYPTENVLPLGGEYVMVGTPKLSVAVAPPNFTTAALPEMMLTLAGTLLNTGGTVSTTPVLESAPTPITEARPRTRRKPFTEFE